MARHHGGMRWSAVCGLWYFLVILTYLLNNIIAKIELSLSFEFFTLDPRLHFFDFSTDIERSLASDLFLHCLPMSHRMKARLISVKCMFASLVSCVYNVLR